MAGGDCFKQFNRFFFFDIDRLLWLKVEKDFTLFHMVLFILLGSFI